MVDVNIGIALITILVFVFYWYLTSPKCLPPGPVGLPLVGYLPFISRAKSHKQFNDLAKKHGPIFSLYFGNRLVIVLNDYETVKDAFVRQGDVFSGRPQTYTTFDEPQFLGLTFAEGEIWKTHRKFISNLLKDLGVGKLSIEPLLTDEIQHFLTELQKSAGKSTDFSDLLTSSISNNICILVYGKRFKYDDPWFKKSKQLIKDHVNNSSVVSASMFMPWLRHLPGLAKLFKQENLLRLSKDYQTSMHETICDAKSKYADGDRNSYLNAFIGEQKNRKMKYKNDVAFSDNALIQNARTMMIAGTETSTSTLMWAILCMIRYPEVQRQVQKEIDKIIGNDRTPCWNDKLRTPYTEATILEVQRFKTVVPLNIPHKNTEKCELFGYTIPKDTIIVSNLWAIHNDAKLWVDPEVFRPERFLTVNGEVDRKDYLIPFSMGKRECVGISLAKMELYLYFTSMLQKFTFKSADGSPPSMEEIIVGTIVPKYFNTRVMLRNPQ